MSDQQKPQVYLIYGISDSGRREVIFDLIESGIDHDKTVLYFRPEEEPCCSFDKKLEALENVSVVTWKLSATTIKHEPVKASPQKVIFLAPGTCNAADVAEALKKWMNGNQCQIARIVTVVHCAFLSQNMNALPWFDACIHFSDVILLNRRENVSNKWIKDFESSYRKQYCPARFLFVKKGRVSNPFEVLEPEARRLSLYFDELIPIEDDDLEDDEAPEDIQPDKYIQRLENGQRVRPIPNILKFITLQEATSQTKANPKKEEPK